MLFIVSVELGRHAGAASSPVAPTTSPDCSRRHRVADPSDRRRRPPAAGIRPSGGGRVRQKCDRGRRSARRGKGA